MISLFLNTSSKYLSVCLYSNNKILTSVHRKMDKDLSRDTLYTIEKILNENNLKPQDIDEILCVRGPGSFTGLRVGVTIAKTMAYFLNKKLYSISTLEIMALSQNDNIKIPIIDARRGFVYAAIYDEDNTVLLEEKYISLKELEKIANNLKKDKIFISNDNFEIETSKYEPNFENIIMSNFRKEENPMTFIPVYLKKTEAEEKLYDSEIR